MSSFTEHTVQLMKATRFQKDATTTKLAAAGENTAAAIIERNDYVLH